jgi:hypothetical protein
MWSWWAESLEMTCTEVMESESRPVRPPAVTEAKQKTAQMMARNSSWGMG